jgi:hypothetical protein
MKIFTSSLNLNIYAESVYSVRIKVDFTVMFINGWKSNW